MKRKAIFSSLVVAAAFILAVPAYVLAENQQLKSSQVCMMNNAFMGTEQIPVEVNGKTYYGCCQGCKKSLAENATLRSAVDPLSGDKVDKADAFIVRDSIGGQKVLYFKSEENYKTWLTSQANALNMSIQPADKSK